VQYCLDWPCQTVRPLYSRLSESLIYGQTNVTSPPCIRQRGRLRETNVHSMHGQLIRPPARLPDFGGNPNYIMFRVRVKVRWGTAILMMGGYVLPAAFV